MTKRLTIALTAAAALLIAAPLRAATVTCPDPPAAGDRVFNVELNVGDTGGATCYDTGTGNINGNNSDFAGYTFIEKDDGPSGTGLLEWGKDLGVDNSGWFWIASSVWETYGSLLLVFKSGVGSYDPDWAAFRLTPIVSGGNWWIDPTTAGGLSHLMIYGGDPVVPEPASMLLFGTGLIGIARAARKRFQGRRG